MAAGGWLAAPDLAAPASDPSGVGEGAADSAMPMSKPAGGRLAVVDLVMPASNSGGGRPAAAGGRPAAPYLAALASDPGGAGEGAADPAMAGLDPAMAEGGQPPTMAASSPQGGDAMGKGEEEATGVVKVKTGLTRGGSLAMEAAAVAPMAGERRGEGGEPSALIPCRKG
ncbi:hypothetical protein GUJ93_ZPchr0002g24287 [Zizania palustris]|uniref:Uncharacterized protein n=1 Tax=Zizania palustris TaxID=103762 RepID=A0A8J5RU25_ZIZPA|nr:hypothetical protein GUJ93_ZPchr0002g24287 [Zizania palustris]